jgi:hypothetical protein
MGNCSFNKDKERNGQNDEGNIYYLNILQILEKISKNNFIYMYAIGKGGFGRVSF